MSGEPDEWGHRVVNVRPNGADHQWKEVWGLVD